MALYEAETPFRFHLLDWRDPTSSAEFERRWPLKRMPLLVDGERSVAESSVIIEHLQVFHPGSVRLIPTRRSWPWRCGSWTACSTTTSRLRSN